MRATLFHNPSAGGKAAKDEILAAMKLVDYVSVKDGDMKEAFKKKADLIVVAGGDGTIAEVLTRLPDRSLPVALLPLGTANNIARSLGIAGTPQELVETWKIDKTHSLDVGMVKASWGTLHFLEGFGVGLFAEFLKSANKGEKPKGADNLRKGRALFEKRVKAAKPIDDASGFAELPDPARRYTEFVERELEVPVELIGTGAERERVLTR